MPKGSPVPGKVANRLPDLGAELPPPPSADLDDILDAGARCFARFGLRRTSVQDVARDLGVDRTTIYRRVGNIDEIARLLAARELHRFLADVAELATSHSPGPEAVVETLAGLIEKARTHPVVVKLLADERELVGSVVAQYARPFIKRTSSAIAPVIGIAMQSGQLARRDPEVVAEWLVRIGASLVLVKPDGDLRALLDDMLLPALRPEAATPIRSAGKATKPTRATKTIKTTKASKPAQRARPAQRVQRKA
jgi:AcrR family transcriptional regulator